MSHQRFVSVGCRYFALASIVVTSMFLARPLPLQAQVLSDEQLLEWAHDTYERRDFLYAALHINALLQRNPAVISNTAGLSQQLTEALTYCIDKLKQDNDDAAAYRNRQREPAQGGVASVTSHLEKPPPAIQWPKDLAITNRPAQTIDDRARTRVRQ